MCTCSLCTAFGGRVVRVGSRRSLRIAFEGRIVRIGAPRLCTCAHCLRVKVSNIVHMSHETCARVKVNNIGCKHVHKAFSSVINRYLYHLILPSIGIFGADDGRTDDGQIKCVHEGATRKQGNQILIKASSPRDVTCLKRRGLGTFSIDRSVYETVQLTRRSLAEGCDGGWRRQLEQQRRQSRVTVALSHSQKEANSSLVRKKILF
jgi:hypothetical protein